MKLFSYGKDGGKASHVWGFWLVEIKSLFSIVVLCFEEGSREAYHTHAFNALTWWVKGHVTEYHKDGLPIDWKPSFTPKFTARTCYHKVVARKRSWAISIRGPWQKTWKEYVEASSTELTLTNGRKVVGVGK